MIATPLVPCVFLLLTLPPGHPQGPHPAPAVPREAAPELITWPVSERALLGAILVDGRERWLGTVRDAFLDGASGRVLLLAVEPRGAAGTSVHLGRGAVAWEFERQRLVDVRGGDSLARPSAASAPTPAGAPAAAPWAGMLPLPAGALLIAAEGEPLWSLADLAQAELTVGRSAHPVRGLVLEPDARRVLAVVVARGAGELALPPAALARAPDGGIFLRDGARALEDAPAARGPALDALADPGFRSRWEDHWAARQVPPVP